MLLLLFNGSSLEVSIGWKCCVCSVDRERAEDMRVNATGATDIGRRGDRQTLPPDTHPRDQYAQPPAMWVYHKSMWKLQDQSLNLYMFLPLTPWL